jgi:signal transduction histidine kinase
MDKAIRALLIKSGFRCEELESDTRFVRLAKLVEQESCGFSESRTNSNSCSAFQEVAVAICQVNAKLEIEDYNQRFRKLSNCEMDTLFGAPLADVLPAEPVSHLREAVRSLLEFPEKAESHLKIDFRMRPIGNGCKTELDKSWFNITVRLVGADSGQRSFVIVFQDATEMHQATTQLRQSQAALLYSEKMAALGEMAGGLAHEINNPLAIISGRARLLTNRLTAMATVDPSERRELLQYCDSILATSDRVSRIVAGLKVFSRRSEVGEVPRPEPIELAELVLQTYELCKERFKNANISVNMQLSVKPCRILGVPDQLIQLLVNLLNNSFDSIATQNNPWVIVKLNETNGIVSLVMEDSGPGIPKENVQRIFQPFFTTKTIGQGSGLGLSICKGIAESHGGSLRLDENAVNTTFVIDFPAVRTI